MTAENPYDLAAFNDEQRAERDQQLRNASHLAGLSDAEVIAWQPGPTDDRHLMEMMRRLKDEIAAFRTSSDRLGTRAVWLTGVLVVATLALVAFAIITAVNGG